MITSVIELADALYKTAINNREKAQKVARTLSTDELDVINSCTVRITIMHIVTNANDIGLPLSVVQQLLKDTGYEELI